MLRTRYKVKKYSKTFRVLIAAEKSDEVFDWISTVLSEEFIVEKYYVHPNPDNPPFLLTRWLLVIINFVKLQKKFKPDKVLIFGKSLISVWLIIFLIRLFKLKTEIILFRYDIEHFRPFSKGFRTTVGHYITLKLEKFCFLKSDKIIHKGLERALKTLPFYGRIKNKPRYLFREFLSPRPIQKYDPNIKLSKKDGEIHLVYVGGFSPVSLSYIESIWEFYPKITDQKLHLHIYSKFDKQTEDKLKEINLKNPYFHYEGIKTHDIMIKEISKYDYGISLHTRNVSKFEKNYYVLMSFGNKYFDYISAKLPIICSNNLIVLAKFIDKYSIGMHIDYNKVNSLKGILIKNKKNYHQMIKNIDKATVRLLDHKKFIGFVNS